MKTQPEPSVGSILSNLPFLLLSHSFKLVSKIFYTLLYFMVYDRCEKQFTLQAVLPAHNIAEFFQIISSKVPVIPVTPLDILINSVQI